MTQTLENLEHQIRSMQGIRSVVHTMKTLSAINATPYERAARSIESYQDVILSGMRAILHAGGKINTSTPASAERIFLAFGSDHGLCGNYNERIAEAVAASAQQQDSRRYQVLCVGSRVRDALDRLDIPVRDVLFTPANADGLARLAGELVTQVDAIRSTASAGAVSIELLYTSRLSNGEHEVRDERLLPLSPELVEKLQNEPYESVSLPWMRESSDTLFASLVRHFLFAGIYRAAADAMAAENAARLARMQQAERAVDDQLQLLADQTRSARQTQITEELMDVIVGFEALRDKKQLA